MGLLASTIYDGVLVTLTFHTENCNLHYFNSLLWRFFRTKCSASTDATFLQKHLLKLCIINIS